MLPCVARKSWLRPAAVGGVALVLGGCGGEDGPAGPQEKGGTIRLSTAPGRAIEYDKKRLETKAGDVTIEYTNRSRVPHNVAIRGAPPPGGTRVVQRESITAKVKLEPGKYTFYCAVQNHEALGMKGTLIVR